MSNIKRPLTNIHGENVSRSRVVDFINREIQARRITSQGAPGVQSVIDQFQLQRDFRNSVRGLIRTRVERYNEQHPIQPDEPEDPNAVVVDPRLPIVPPVDPNAVPQPVQVDPPREDPLDDAACDNQPAEIVEPGNDAPQGEPGVVDDEPMDDEHHDFEPSGNSTAFLNPNDIGDVEEPQDLNDTLPEMVAVNPEARVLLTDVVDPEERNRIVYLLNYYSMMDIRRQLLFHAYTQLPTLRYNDADNTVRTLTFQIRNSVLGMFWGCMLNGRQFRDVNLNRNRCLRLRNNTNDGHNYFSTHHTGWQLINAFQVAYPNADFNVDYTIVTRDDLLAPQSTAILIYANMDLEENTIIVFPTMCIRC